MAAWYPLGREATLEAFSEFVPSGRPLETHAPRFVLREVRAGCSDGSRLAWSGLLAPSGTVDAPGKRTSSSDLAAGWHAQNWLRPRRLWVA
jgi:hypothetical protein